MLYANMVFQVELLYLVVMVATFLVLMLLPKVKMPTGLALICASIVGALLSAIISKTEFSFRIFVEGGLGYFDTILVIVAAMIFIEGLDRSGAMEYFSVILVKAFRKMPTVLLVAFMFILLLPGMITGSSLAACISVGAIVAPIMIKMGIPKAKTAAFIGIGAILGMVAPPVNVPVIAICDVCDIPYTGFDMPLMLLTFPCAYFACIFFSRSFKKDLGAEEVSRKRNWLDTGIIAGVTTLAYTVLLIFTLIYKGKAAADSNLTDTYKTLMFMSIAMAVFYIGIMIVMFLGKPYSSEINLEEMDGAINLEVTKELKPVVLIPLFVIVLLYVMQAILPRVFGILGTPLFFIIAYVFSIFFGRKFNPIYPFKDGVTKSFGAMGLLIGVGTFIEIMTLTGVRGWFVYNAISLPNVWQYISIVVAMPIFGGISAFGSASILGGPYVMALLTLDNTIVASALSLVAATGEFLPPTAMSATLGAKQVGLEGYSKVTKEAAIPIVLILAYSMFFIIEIATCWIG